jgi:hypothetical protein
MNAMVRQQRVALTVALVVATAAGCGGDAPARPAQATVPSAASPSRSAAATSTGRPAERPVLIEEPARDRGLTDVPARVAVPALAIDLAIVPGDLVVPGNPPDYPLCDVAQYLTTYRYPGRPGTTTWVYGHAREGMFLPLLAASERNDGAALIGLDAVLDSTASRRYTYNITRVIRHATDRSAARDVAADAGRLVLQTSEGPRGTIPKLQVVARLVSVDDVPVGEPPVPGTPRVCATE